MCKSRPEGAHGAKRRSFPLPPPSRAFRGECRLPPCSVVWSLIAATMRPATLYGARVRSKNASHFYSLSLALALAPPLACRFIVAASDRRPTEHLGGKLRFPSCGISSASSCGICRKSSSEITFVFSLFFSNGITFAFFLFLSIL